jgi:hypothetical protein
VVADLPVATRDGLADVDRRSSCPSTRARWPTDYR